MKQILIKSIFLIILLFLANFLPVFAGGDAYVELGWEELKLAKGGVRSCIITAAEEDSFFPETLAAYDEKGKLVQLDTGFSIQKFVYNNNGIAEIQYGGPGEDGTFLFYGKTLYIYDPKGKLVKISYMDGEGNEYMTEEGISYEKNGNIKIERQTPEGSVYQVDTYTKNLDLIESLTYTGESVAMGLGKKEIESKMTVKYDKNNNVIEKTTEYITTPDESMPKKTVQSFKYEFDKKGNKISQKTSFIPEAEAALFSYLLLPPLKFEYSTEAAKPQKVQKEPGSDFTIDQEVTVLWEGSWYPAVILEQDGNKYLVHYADYDSSWDEWVTQDRIKPAE